MSEIVTKAAEEATKTANGLLAKIFGPSAETMGMNMAQGIRLRAVQNQIRGLKKLAAICEEEKFSMKQVNIKAAFPYLEGIALEEEPVLEDMWANLMANYLDSKKNQTQTVYPTILKQFSTLDVKILDFVIKNSIVTITNYNVEGAANNGQFTYSEVGNLERLGLVEEDFSVIKQKISADMNRIGLSNSSAPPQKKTEYVITQFGKDFYEACQR